MKFERHAHGAGPMHLAHEDERGVFELYPIAPGQPPDCTGLGFAVDDVEVVRSKLTVCGYNPDAVKSQPWGRTFVVRDPDGRRVEVRAKSPVANVEKEPSR